MNRTEITMALRADRHIAPETCEEADCTKRASLYDHINDRWLCRVCFGLDEWSDGDSRGRCDE